MNISKIMTSRIITARPDDTLYDVATQMKTNAIGFVPVVNGERLLGVITDRDLVIRGYAEKKSDNTPIKDIMTCDCITVSKDISVDDAARIMADHQVRRLCVIDNNCLVGVCAIGDLAVRNRFEDEAGHALSDISSNQQEARH